MIIKNYFLFDRRRSCLSEKEIRVFKAQIYKHPNMRFFPTLTTCEVMKTASKNSSNNNKLVNEYTRDI